jgi:hypothetical protein
MHRPGDEPRDSVKAVSQENETEARLPRNKTPEIHVETVGILPSPQLVIILSVSYSDELLWHVKLTWHQLFPP